jgi:sugar phosphate isomerase/epimerase
LEHLNKSFPGAHDAPFGTGDANIRAILPESKRHHFSGNVSIEYDYNWTNNLAEVAQCLRVLRGLGMQK